MANLNMSVDSAKQQAEHTVRRAGPGIEKLARAGYAAKGVVYIIIGLLALQAAFTGGGKTTNNQGALATIAQQPFGQFLLVIVGVGLAGYALWRFVEAGIDSENKGSDARGITTRIGYVLSGVAYAALAFTAFQLITGRASSPNGATTQDWTARLLSMPFGQWVVGFGGIVVIGLGLAQMVKGYTADFDKALKLNALAPTQRKWVVMSGRWGYLARGVVFAILGGFFIEAALNANAQQAKGLGSALDLLAEQPYGRLLLGIVAAGLAAYGVFMLVEARYRRIAL